jgi:hypothetical protein
MNREYSKRLMPGIYYGSNRRGNRGGWLLLIRLGNYGLNLGTGFSGYWSLRSWEWARYDYADHFSYEYAPDHYLGRWMAAYPGRVKA